MKTRAVVRENMAWEWASGFSLRGAAKGKTCGWLVPVFGAAVAVLMSAGCAAKSGTLQTYMIPHSLYLAGQPYDRLYVEVDCIEGVEVSDRWLAALRGFLAEHCGKPGGIEVVRDPPVSARQVEGIPVEVAALCTLDGPPPRDESQPAYLHLFFYDARGARSRPKGVSYVDGLCPSSIFYRASRVRHWDERVAVSCLEHEAGHILGLTRNPAHGDGAHCRNRGCLMRPSPDLLANAALLFGGSWEASLCDECRRDLAAARSAGADGRFSFVGPFLVRREAGYSIASLPGWHAIVVSPLDQGFDWRKALSEMKMTVGKRRDQLGGQVRPKESGGDPWCFHPVYAPADEGGEFTDSGEVRAALEKARHDPCPRVRHVAEVRLQRLKERPKNESENAEIGAPAS
jgi:hypothetical protein